jgi:hypothetical protein
MAAGRRAEKLRKQVGEGEEGLEPQRRFTEIREGFPGRPEAASIAMTEALLAEFPDWVGAPTVAIWLAEIDLRAGRYGHAARRYAAVAERYPISEVRFDALLGAGDASMRLGDFAAAARFYRQLETGGDPGRETLRREALRELERARGRSRFALGAWILALVGILALCATILLATRSARGALRALWPPPGEVLYLAPVAAILSATAFTGYDGLGPAVTTVSLAGVLVAWLSGAGLRLAAGRIRIVAVHAVAAAAVVVAAIYLALYRNRLIDPVLDTLRFGPDR